MEPDFTQRFVWKAHDVVLQLAIATAGIHITWSQLWSTYSKCVKNHTGSTAAITVARQAVPP